MVLYEMSTYLSNDMYLPALPDMMRDLHISSQQVQLTLAIWFGGLAVTPLIFGAICDRYGRRPVLLIGGIFYILATIACALSTDLNLLLMARFLQGCMIPSMMVAGYASIHELYSHREAITILALMSSITVLAPAFGPLLGSVILYIGDWRDIFWIIAIWSSVTIFFLFFKMPETHSKEMRHPIHLPNLLKSYWRVISNKNYMLQLTILSFLFGGLIVWITTSPLLVIDSFHYSAISYGFFQAFVFVIYILGNRSVDYLITRIGINKLINRGLVLCLVGGMLASILAIAYPHTLYPYVSGLSLYSLGTALCFAPLNRLIVEASEEPMGLRVAFFTVFLMLFLSFASTISGILYNGTIISLAILTTLAAILAFVFKQL
jgi:Bcr/CflA subfamily drug resistance transporter